MTTAKKTSSTAIKRIRGDVVFDVVNASILIVMMLVVLYPLIYVVSCSVSSPLLVVQSKVVLFPKGMTKVAYEHVFNNSLILSGYGNTILYTLIGTSINLVMTIRPPSRSRRKPSARARASRSCSPSPCSFRAAWYPPS